jgi:hypothetical protein
MTRYCHCGIACSLAVALILAPAASAQEIDLNAVHWAYSSYFGTGWYKLGNDRNAYVFRMTPRWKLREASIDEDRKRHMGIEFRLSVTAGLDSLNFDNLPGTVDPDNIASMSITPGVDIEIPLSDRWALRPFAALGWGTLLDGRESAWTYWGGLRSRYLLRSGKMNWALINSIALVGYAPSIGSSQNFLPISAGFEFDYRLADKWIGDERAVLHWHVLYTVFENELDLIEPSAVAGPISDQWELGLSASKQSGRMQFGWFNFERLGLAYRFSSDGELKGISLVLRSLFDL